MIAGGDLPDYGLSIWDQDGEFLRRLPPHGATIQAACWSPDGKQIATGGREQEIRLFSVDSGELLQTVRLHVESINDMDWSKEGRIVSVGDSRAYVWQPSTTAGHRSVLTEGQATGAAWNIIGWSPNGEWLAGACLDGKVRIWNSRTDALESTHQTHASPLSAVAWRPDGAEIAVIDEQGEIAVIAFPGGAEGRRIRTDLRANFYNTISWSADGRWLASGGGPFGVLPVQKDELPLEVWDAQTGARVHCVPSLDSQYLAFSPDSRWIAYGTHLEDLRERKPSGQIRVAGCTALAWRPDGRIIAAASFQGPLVLLDPLTSSRIAERNDHGHGVSSVAWSHDAARIATGGSDGSIVVWDAATLEVLLRIPSGGRSARSLAWSPDDRRLVSAGPDGIRIWGSPAIDTRAGPVAALDSVLDVKLGPPAKPPLTGPPGQD